MVKQNNKKTNTKTNTKTNSISKFEDIGSDISSGYEDLIDILSISPSAGDKKSITWNDQFNDYVILFLKYSCFVGILILNFLGLSVSLNCNSDQELTTRIFSAIFAFFFGVVYLLVNYYTFKVLSQGKMCKMNRDKLFPFRT